MWRFKFKCPVLRAVVFGCVGWAAGTGCQRNTDAGGGGQPSSRFQVVLSGESEVPPVATETKGIAIFDMDTAGSELSYELWIWGGDGITEVHVALGGSTENGGAVAVLFGSAKEGVSRDSSWVTGAVTDADLIGELEGMPVSALVDEVRAGNAYVEVQSESHPQGEIRGQVDPAASEAVRPITIETLWVGYYADTWRFLSTLGDGQIGPDLSVEDTLVFVDWLGVVYEDCQEPDGFLMTRAGDTIVLSLEEAQKPCTTSVDCGDGEDCFDGVCWGWCVDSDYVSNVNTWIELERGTYRIVVLARVYGFNTRNGPPQIFDITIP